MSDMKIFEKMRFSFFCNSLSYTYQVLFQFSRIFLKKPKKWPNRTCEMENFSITLYMWSRNNAIESYLFNTMFCWDKTNVINLYEKCCHEFCTVNWKPAMWQLSWQTFSMIGHCGFGQLFVSNVIETFITGPH